MEPRVALMGAGGWKWQELHQKLSSTNVAILALIALRPDSEQVGRMAWLEARGGKFTALAAYKLANRWVEESLGGWKLVWKMKTQ